MSEHSEDYVLVPRVPTREMIDAALRWCEACEGYPPPEDAYAAMLSAAPARYTGTVGGLHLFEVASIPDDDTDATGQDRPNTEGQAMELKDRVIEVGDTVEVVGKPGQPYLGQRFKVEGLSHGARWPFVLEGGVGGIWDKHSLKLIAKAKPITANPGRAEPIYGSVSDEDKQPENLTSDTHSRGGPVSDIGLLWAAIDELRQSNRDRLSEIGRLVGIAEALLTPPAR